MHVGMAAVFQNTGRQVSDRQIYLNELALADMADFDLHRHAHVDLAAVDLLGGLGQRQFDGVEISASNTTPRA